MKIHAGHGSQRLILPSNALPSKSQNRAKNARAVFLDRDGVINAYVYNPEFGTVDSPAHPNEFVLLPEAARAIAELNRAGLPVIVISNQPGIAKRKFNLSLLGAMTEKMHVETRKAGGRIDAVYYCLHHPQSALPQYRALCNCRKPGPGLLLQAAEDWGLDLGKSYMVGDGVTDIQAGAAAGAKTILIGTRKCYLCDELVRQNVRPMLMVDSLLDAARDIGFLERNVKVPREHLVAIH